MAYHYHIFGLNVSTPLPFLDIPQEKCNVPDITVHYGQVPTSLQDVRIKGVRYQAGNNELLLHIDNVARFHISKGSEITIERHPHASDHEVLLFFMGSAIGAILHQRRLLPLHGSAIACNNKGVIFSGPSGIGKSTLAAGFHKLGYTLLADDICAIKMSAENMPVIIPGFPRLKLWEDALKKLKQSQRDLKRVRLEQNFKKYFLPFENISTTCIPVSTVFVIRTTNINDFKIEQIGGSDKFDTVLANTYRHRFLEGIGEKKHHFKLGSELVKHASVYQITRPQKGFLLEELMDLVKGVLD